MPEVTDLMRVAQYVKSDRDAPSDVYNAACRMLDGPPAGSFPWHLKQVEAERDALKAAINAAMQEHQVHVKVFHPTRLLDPRCPWCRIGLVLSRERPAKPDSREELQALVDESSARLAIERALACHPRDDSNPRGPWCNTCLTVWPCVTARALAAPESPATWQAEDAPKALERRMRKALDDADWGGPDRGDAVADVRKAMFGEDAPTEETDHER